MPQKKKEIEKTWFKTGITIHIHPPLMDVTQTIKKCVYSSYIVTIKMQKKKENFPESFTGRDDDIS